MERVHLEFPLNCNSRTMIWEMVGNANGLTAWMADEVSSSNGIFTFRWGRDEVRVAQQIGQRIGTYIRFHWLDESPRTFFELRINFSELTRSFSLEVTEVTDDDDAEGLSQLWESYVDKLIRTAGL